MADRPFPEGYEAGAALLERIRGEGANADHLGVELAVALGILLAEGAGIEGNGRSLLSLAGIVIQASFCMRQARAILADCKGSA